MQHPDPKIVGFNEDVKGQDQNREQAKQAADHAGDGTEDGPDRFAAMSDRRMLDGLGDSHPLLEDALRDEKVLCLIEHPGQRRPQLLCLIVDRWRDEEADADEYADDEEIQNEYGEPSRKTGADRHRLLALD